MLTDQFLSDSRFSVEDFELDKIEPSSHLADPSKIKDYQRYQLSEDGISRRLYPGQSEHLVGIDSDEHDEEGHITEDLAHTAVAMVNKRLTKLEGLKKEINPPEEAFLDNANVVLVGWGSSRQAILEAIHYLKEDGVQAGMIHFTEMCPCPITLSPRGKST